MYQFLKILSLFSSDGDFFEDNAIRYYKLDVNNFC